MNPVKFVPDAAGVGDVHESTVDRDADRVGTPPDDTGLPPDIWGTPRGRTAPPRSGCSRRRPRAGSDRRQRAAGHPGSRGLCGTNAADRKRRAGDRGQRPVCVPDEAGNGVRDRGVVVDVGVTSSCRPCALAGALRSARDHERGQRRTTQHSQSSTHSFCLVAQSHYFSHGVPSPGGAPTFSVTSTRIVPSIGAAQHDHINPYRPLIWNHKNFSRLSRGG